MDVSVNCRWDGDYPASTVVRFKELGQVDGISHRMGCSSDYESSKAKVIHNLKSFLLLLLCPEFVLSTPNVVVTTKVHIVLESLSGHHFEIVVH